MIQMIDESLAELKPKQQPPSSKPTPTPKPAAASPTPPPQPEKWSRENHPAFKKPVPTPPTQQDEKDEAAVNYAVNDTVMAKWVSGDKGWYTARITAVTGSSTKPMYTVKFKSYDTIETVGAYNIKPAGGGAHQTGTKRKAEEQQHAHAPAGTEGRGDGAVLAAPATVYPRAEGAGDGEDGKPAKKFKKIKANKELEKGKNRWQEFQGKVGGKGKVAGKRESMFRTPEGVGGRGELIS